MTLADMAIIWASSSRFQISIEPCWCAIPVCAYLSLLFSQAVQIRLIFHPFYYELTPTKLKIGRFSWKTFDLGLGPLSQEMILDHHHDPAEELLSYKHEPRTDNQLPQLISIINWPKGTFKNKAQGKENNNWPFGRSPNVAESTDLAFEDEANAAGTGLTSAIAWRTGNAWMAALCLAVCGRSDSPRNFCPARSSSTT